MRLRTAVSSPLSLRRFDIDAVAITVSLDERLVPDGTTTIGATRVHLNFFVTIHKIPRLS